MSFVFLFAGLFIAGFTVYYFRDRYNLSQKSKTWPVVKGMILSESTSSPTSSQHVKYQYIIGQHRYTATRISFFGHIRFGFMAPAKPARYWKGQHIDVHYDPAAHHMSVLQPGIALHSIVPFFVPLMLGTGLIIYSFFI